MSKTKPHTKAPKGSNNKRAPEATHKELRPSLKERHASARPDETGEVPRALHAGILRFGAIEVPCCVLADGTALLTTRGIATILAGTETGILRRLIERIPEEHRGFPLEPERSFRLPGNNALAKGHPADTLTRICRAYNAAFWAGALHPSQQPLAARANVILSAVADAGITALVWEATGYDRVKAEGALQDKLALTLRHAAGKYEVMFSPAFFAELARLYRVELEGRRGRPMVFAAFLAEFFYEWFDRDVYTAVKGKNPRLEELDGEREYCHHQFLTDYARERFVRHQRDVLVLMRATHSLAEFRNRFNAVFRGMGLQLSFGGAP